ncbi:hypothetical protein ELH33_33005 (plasmid) [Rhizobium ruizarguesonis]|uniref:hypothetical protein n=1 Tax=Rhizobium ruizarguesonis TaxID=2081791 RepID=UPI00103014DE|nr:hypothetical protein [Rhizobium ruizarguesonis]TBC25597.1 hypothetical protein ELH33_33005 [Rhizobium ruizarguesonis]
MRDSVKQQEAKVCQLAAVSVFTMLAITALHRPVEARELILNYQDPHGAALLLAIIPSAGDLPDWLEAAKGAGNKVSEFALSPSESSGMAEKRSRYILELPSQATDKMAPVDIGPTNGPRVEIQPINGSLRPMPECGTNSVGREPCKVSSLANEVVATALQQSRDESNGFADLLASKNLVMDDRASKRVIVTLDNQDVVEHTDFVGLVRGRDESLPAPDAVSTFVVRMNAEGGLSIVERHAEAVDPNSIEFEYEGNP